MITMYDRLKEEFDEALESLYDLENKMDRDRKEYNALEKQVNRLREELLINYID